MRKFYLKKQLNPTLQLGRAKQAIGDVYSHIFLILIFLKILWICDVRTFQTF